MMPPKAIVVLLSEEERAAYAEYKLTIGQGLRMFVAVGLALRDIRERRLYREEYKTWEAFCQAQHGFGRKRAHQLIEAAQLTEELSSTVDIPIDNERQARALAAVPNHLRKEVAGRIQEQELDITEQVVTRLVNQILDERRQATREWHAPDEPDESPEVVQTRKTLKSAAKKQAKERLYLSRGLEHLRLAVKDFCKVEPGDLKTKKARSAATDGLEAAEVAFASIRQWIAQEESKEDGE